MPYFVYILTNSRNTVLYTGVTNNLSRRLNEHLSKESIGFVKKYNLNKLVYCEVFDDPENAIQREKQIKAGSRKKKVALIEVLNHEWKDLSSHLY